MRRQWMMVVLGIAWATTGWAWPFPDQKAQAKMKELTAEYSKLQNDNETLKKKFRNLEEDRNNVLNQTKILLAERSKALELEELYQKLKKTRQILANQTDKLHKRSRRLRLENITRVKNFDRLKASYEELQTKHNALVVEDEGTRAALKQRVESTPQFQKLNNEVNRLKNENKKLEDMTKTLEDKLKKAISQIQKIEDKDAKLTKKIQLDEQKISQLESEKVEFIKTIKTLNDQVQKAPKRFKDMAQENKTMLKETAQMHYNLGVFFTRNKSYDRAVEEFKRALDFNPDNPQVHYNLGYIYAEEYEQQEEAMAHFRRFLEIDPNSKEAHEVRSYLLVRETYAGRSVKN